MFKIQWNSYKTNYSRKHNTLKAERVTTSIPKKLKYLNLFIKPKQKFSSVPEFRNYFSSIVFKN